MIRGAVYAKYIPEKYGGYIPDMDNNGVKYKKYMQGQPAAESFQQMVLPQGDYQQYIPLSGASKDEDPKGSAAAVMLAAGKSEKRHEEGKREEAKDSSSGHEVRGDSDSGMNFEKYMPHAPSPGPVVSRKYAKYIPQKYGDYVPEMDSSGVKYQKYMQGKPAAESFQEKVLPQGDYQQYIPLSGASKDEDPKGSAAAVMLAAGKSEKRHEEGKREEAKDSSSGHEVRGDSDSGMNFEKYMPHAPSPGPVVSNKYAKYIPQKYGDYVPEMDSSGVKYQKYMQGQPAAESFQEKVLPQGDYQQYIPLSGASKDEDPKGSAAAVMLAAGKSEKRHEEGKREEAKDSSSGHEARGDSNSGMNFEKYMPHAPSPGPVVSNKYAKYIPQKYGDYVPEMDSSGVKYKKYMQGQPAAESFQEKVLPQGDYQQYIPLSGASKDEDPKGSAAAVMLAAGKSEKRHEEGKREEAKDSSSGHEARGDSNSGMNFEKYMPHAPSPGPVVSKRYAKYIPQKYGDYVPEMDKNGVKYQKYMQGQPESPKAEQVAELETTSQAR